MVSPERCAELLGHVCEDKMYETLGRNVGVMFSTGEVIVSTNPKIIVPSRSALDSMIYDYVQDSRKAIILEREEITAQEAVALTTNNSQRADVPR